MLTAEGPKLIEYNVRFGDPETQPMMMRLDSDLLELLVATVKSTLKTVTAAMERRRRRFRWSWQAGGYPGTYDKGSRIGGIAEAERIDGVKIFHAGTALIEGALVSAGGRVLNVTARGASIEDARKRAYGAVGMIDWANGFCRSDIGARAAERD